jgi:hypothetical protein
MTAALQTKALGWAGAPETAIRARPTPAAARRRAGPACLGKLPATGVARCLRVPLPQNRICSRAAAQPAHRATATVKLRGPVQTSVAGCTSQFSFDAASGKVSERPLAASTTWIHEAPSAS